MKTQPTEIPFDWLICPVTKEKLILKDGVLYSSYGHFHRNHEFNFWNLIPERLLNKPEWNIWKKLQENGMISYKTDPKNNLGVGGREDFIEFSRFCNFSGIVLDVGVGPQKIPTHIEYCNKPNIFFTGIDPIVGAQPRPFAFLLGLGEYLPFRDKLFDQVIFVTSLDHFIDPRIPLFESKRVLKDNGTICIWHGEKDKNILKRIQKNKWYEDLVIPEGAEDKFHFKRFSIHELENYLKDVKLSIIDKVVTYVDEWRSNIFLRLEK